VCQGLGGPQPPDYTRLRCDCVVVCMRECHRARQKSKGVCVCVLGRGGPVGAHSSLQGSHPGLQGLQSAPYLAAQEVQGGTQSCG
jgi:hypothetical protein